MGRTPKPLQIAVTDPAMLEWPEIVELASMGHEFVPCEHLYVLGPGAFRMNAQLRKYLDLTIKGMWELAYPRKEK